jgi:F-type H+-transporting ATPase subunit a
MPYLLAAGDNPLNHVVRHHLFTWQGIDVDNHMLMQAVAGILLMWLLPIVVLQRRGVGQIDSMIPTGFGNFFESICNYLRNEVARPALGEHTDRFIKFIWTVFFFILFKNILGLLPIDPVLSLFGVKGHYGGTATANVWVTGTLAVVTLVMMVVNGLRLGGMHYIAHFCPGPLVLAPLLIPIEIIGLVAKAFALGVRLFANMIAGHVLLAVLVGFVGSAWVGLGSGVGILIGIPVVIGSVAITMLEIFVAFLQAFIFTFLTCMFLGMSVVFHHDDVHGHAEGAHH